MTKDEIAHEPISAPCSTEFLDASAVHARAATLEQQAHAFIQQRPIVAVLAAAGIGYLVARALVRGTR